MMFENLKFKIVGTGKHTEKKRLFKINMDVHIEPKFNMAQLDKLVRVLAILEYGPVEVLTWTVVFNPEEHEAV